MDINKDVLVFNTNNIEPSTIIGNDENKLNVLSEKLNCSKDDKIKVSVLLQKQ
jgi:hypothetical protein